MALDARYRRLPFAEALTFLRSKITLDTDRWDDIRDDEADAFFTVAGAKGSLLAELRSAVEDAIERGQRPAEFRQRFSEIAEGWAGNNDWRADLIYRTNLRTAYARGREEYQFDPDVLLIQPYLQFIHSDAIVPRPHHKALDGQVFEAGSVPFALPNGYGCFPAGTLIATPLGWAPIDHIAHGQNVLGGSGNVYPVRQVHTRPYKGQLISIASQQGRKHSATPNHRFLTHRGWVRADGLKPGDVLLNVANCPPFNGAVLNVDKMQTSGLHSKMPIHVKNVLPTALNPQRQTVDLDVDPLASNGVVVSNAVAPSTQDINHHAFAPGGERPCVDVGARVIPMSLNLGRNNLRPNLRAVKAGHLSKLFSLFRHAWIVLFGATPQWMTFAAPILSKFPSAIRRNLPTLRIPDKLNSRRFLPGATGDPASVKQLHNRSVTATPAIGQLGNSHVAINVEEPEGFADRTPFGFFNSSDAVMEFATAHNLATDTVVDVDTSYHDGLVYNLTIEPDDSYCTPLGIVHNCGCRYVSRSPRDLEREGLSLSTISRGNIVGGVPLEPEPGWDRMPGAARGERRQELIQRVIDRSPPEIAAQVKAEIEQYG